LPIVKSAAIIRASMAVVVREARDDDADRIVALLRELRPDKPITPRSWLSWQQSTPARARALSLVAEEDGALVGRAEAGLNWFTAGGAGNGSVGVTGSRRGRGIGAQLFERVESHLRSLGAGRRIQSLFFETPAGVRFATDRGFREARAGLVSLVDPREVDLPIPDGVTLVPVRDLPAEAIHHVDVVATLDMPALHQVTELPFDEWAELVWDNPMFTRDGSFAAVVDGRAVAVTLLLVDDSGSGENTFTGTLREYRGRGLALACKIASLRWAAANGVTRIWTSNDETNAPMLAINRRLGYRPAGRLVEYVRNE
jgi:GNAT superfamily N-acetyltransferase